MKYFYTILYFLLLLPAIGAAGTVVVDGSNSSQLASQQDSATAYAQCVHDAMYGTCPGTQANNCVGANQALANAPKKTVCKVQILFICLKYGHAQNTQEGWVDVANGHLANAKTCSNMNIDAAGRGAELSSLLADTNLSKDGTNPSRYADMFDSNGNFIGNDGSSTYGLENGDIYNRYMKGEKLKDILASSPYVQGLSEKDRKSLLGDGEEQPSSGASAYANKNTNDDSFGISGASNAEFIERTPAATAKKQDSVAAEAISASKEKSIFEIVSAKYQDRQEDFLSTDYYLSAFSIQPKNKVDAFLPGQNKTQK